MEIEIDTADELGLFVMNDDGLERRHEVRRLWQRYRAGPGALVAAAFLRQLRRRGERVDMQRERQ